MKKIILLVLSILLKLQTQSPLYSQWFQQTLPVSGTINDIAFLNKDTGFVAMDNSNLLRTTNGGTNWSIITNYRIFQLEPINSTTIYARAVNQSGFYRTFDGGTNWDYVAGLQYCYLSFINKDTGWLSAFGGIYKTTNGGVTANLISTENNCCTKLMMLKQPYNGEYYGWSIQAFSNGLFKTTNSGVNWIGIQNLPEVLSFFMLNKDTGWVSNSPGVGEKKILFTNDNLISLDTQYVGRDVYGIYFSNFWIGWAGAAFSGRNLATSTSGTIWGTQINPFLFGIGQFSFINSLTGWATNRIILAKTTNGGGIITYIGKDSNNSEIPTSFILVQNYPNPFNPQTTITFSLSKNSVVSLKIYDMQGKEILKLYEEANLIAGNYKAVLDFSKISSLPSGVYFYNLKVLDERSKQVFNETRKMIYSK